MVDRDDARAIVRDGYDAIAERYLEYRLRKPGLDLELLDAALADLRDGACVLDAGCGAGVPVSRRLAERFRVTGIDISPIQVELARAAVPSAEFVVGDMAALELPDASLDAVVCLYALFHLPREEHAAVLHRFHAWLRPAGLLLLSLGFSDGAGYVETDWLDAGARMYWSHYDREANLRLVRDAGFEIAWERLLAEDEEFGGSRHPFVLAQRL